MCGDDVTDGLSSHQASPLVRLNYVVHFQSNSSARPMSLAVLSCLNWAETK